ncbi:MAG TPA: acylphosphatase [Alloacidobacterium sp.]|nr:acylphosphatase [Alloacidobacterium sp.]
MEGGALETVSGLALSIVSSVNEGQYHEGDGVNATRRLARFSCICNTDFCPPFMVRHYLVKGRVQGVGFRWYVHREAGTLNLRGWVRNTEDGHVEVVAAGEAEELASLRLALDRGSRGSRVDQVIEHLLDDSEDKDLGPFQIEGAW